MKPPAMFVILCILISFSDLSAKSAVANEGCARTLIQDYGVLNFSDTASLAAFRLFSQSTTHTGEVSAGLEVPIEGVPADFDMRHARSLTNSYFGQSNLTWDRDRLVSVATQRLSLNSVAAYRACVDGQLESGPRIFVHNATADEASVTIRWISPSGAPTTSALTVELEGGEFTSELPEYLANNTSVGAIVSRSPNDELRIVVNIGGQSDNVFVAPYPECFDCFDPHYQLVGAWICDGVCTIPGGTAYITFEGGQLRLTNEDGTTVDGAYNAAMGNIYAEQWFGNAPATVVGGSLIDWPNDTDWVRRRD